MNFVLENAVLVLIVVASAAMLAWSYFAEAGTKASLEVTQAVQCINKEKGCFVDVSDLQEYQQGHIKKAKHIALADLEAQLPLVFKDKEKSLIMVCPSGVRSLKALSIARRLGYQQVYSLKGGMKAWQAAQMPIEKELSA